MLEKIIDILRRVYKIRNEVITLETSLDELGLDSLERVELVIDIEGEFNVKFTDDDILYMRNVEDLVNTIIRNKGN